MLKPHHLDDCRAKIALARAALRAEPHELYGPLVGYLAMALDDLTGLRAEAETLREEVAWWGRKAAHGCIDGNCAECDAPAGEATP
jgi:hypothetical protein